MESPRIGQILQGMSWLDAHDIEEILSEQKATGKRFGQVALELGMCAPEQLRRALGRQVRGRVRRADIAALGVDVETARLLPVEVARRLNAVVLRHSSDRLLVAVEEANVDAAAEIIPAVLGVDVLIVTASSEQIQAALQAHYPPVRAAG